MERALSEHTYTCTPAALTFIGMGLLILIDAVNNHKIPIESRIESLAMTFSVILFARVNASSKKSNIAGRT